MEVVIHEQHNVWEVDLTPGRRERLRVVGALDGAALRPLADPGACVSNFSHCGHRERVTNHDNGDTAALQSFVGSPRLCHVSESTHRFIDSSAAARVRAEAKSSFIMKVYARD